MLREKLVVGVELRNEGEKKVQPFPTNQKGSQLQVLRSLASVYLRSSIDMIEHRVFIYLCIEKSQRKEGGRERENKRRKTKSTLMVEFPVFVLFIQTFNLSGKSHPHFVSYSWFKFSRVNVYPAQIQLAETSRIMHNQISGHCGPTQVDTVSHYSYPEVGVQSRRKKNLELRGGCIMIRIQEHDPSF